MALPKRRHSRQRQAKRRTHDRIILASLSACPQCGTMRLPHHICPSCGFYKGKVRVVIEEKKAKEAT